MHKSMAEIDRLREEARLWYKADGTCEMLDSAEEVIRRRVEAARRLAEVDRLRSERHDLLEALEIARSGLRWGCTDREPSAAIRIIDAAIARAKAQPAPAPPEG